MENEIKKLKEQIKDLKKKNKKLRKKKEDFRCAMIEINRIAEGCHSIVNDESKTRCYAEMQRVKKIICEVGVVDWEAIGREDEEREHMFEDWDREEEEAERDYCYRRRVALARQRKLEQDEYDEIPPTNHTLGMP